jgi:hypothetical protein
LTGRAKRSISCCARIATAPLRGAFSSAPWVGTACPTKITIVRSGANIAAIVGMLVDSGADIEMQQNKYLWALVVRKLADSRRRIPPGYLPSRRR